jgi:hypothetical protein
VRQLSETLGEANWVRYNAPTRRVVIDNAEKAVDPGEWVARLEELEERLGLLERGFGASTGRSRHHPAELEPLLLELVELGVELAGGVVGLALQGPESGKRLGIDLAMFLRSVEVVPGLREAIEGLLGNEVAESMLSLALGVDHALLRGLAGPLAALLEHSLRLRAGLSQRRLWEGVEAELCFLPDHHPGH